jgi:ADP-heptose:LPS heptosyltransferase
MKSQKEQPQIFSDPKRILLPRFDTLGDIVLLEGFLESLQDLYPQAKLVLLVRKGYETLSPLFPKTIEWMSTDIDPLSALPDASLCEKLVDELPSGEGEMLLTTSYNRTWADDLVAAKLTGAKRFALGEPSEISSFDQALFTQLGLSLDCPYDRFIPVDETSHETEKYEILWRELGGTSKLPEPKLSVPEKHKKAAKRILDDAGLKSKNFYLLFPAGTQRVSIKSWSPERFVEIISWMEEKYQLPFLVAGHESEADCIKGVVDLAHKRKVKPNIWLGKDGEIPVFAALAAAAKMYVGNDTGPMHIAAAVKTPVVAIFGGGTWPRFRPRNDQSLAIAGKMPCFGCGWDCIFADAPCMSLVAVKDVQKAIVSLYDGSGSKRIENQVIAASTELDEGTQRYIEKALETHKRIETDRAARLQDNRRLEQLLKESEEDRDVRLKANQRLVRQLKESEADRAVRLEDNRRLEQMLKESEADRAVRLEDNRRLEQMLKESEADRAARLEAMHRLEGWLKESEENRAKQTVALEQSRSALEALKRNKMVRLLIRLGLVNDGETGEEE